jgi:hypothetical protein
MNEKIIKHIKKPTLKSSVGSGSIINFLNFTLLNPPSKGGRFGYRKKYKTKK